MPWFYSRRPKRLERSPHDHSLVRVGGTAAQLMLTVTALSLAGCHSAHIDATVSNDTASPISLIQIEYPSATFGTQTLSPRQEFHYRFKLLGSGPMKITYTDAFEKEHRYTGPTLQEGNEGTLRVVITSAGVDWQPSLISR